jgi:hypothetical protein
MTKPNIYKDPVNDKILKEISKKIKEFNSDLRKERYGFASKETSENIRSMCLRSYRVGAYAAMNVALKNLGREPL